MVMRSSGFASSQIAKLINDIQSETIRFDRDLRSSHREKITLPVEVRISDDEIITGFTRNISATGVCLLTCSEIEQGINAVIEIYRLKDPMSRILSEVRWSKPFGDRFWISGWQFKGIAR